MSVDEFVDYFTQTVTVEPPSGKNAYGELTYGTSTTYKARIVGRTKTVTDKEGRERVSMYTVYLNTNAVIDPDSRVTLPSGYAPSQPKLLAVGTYPDETGPHHTTLFLG